ncbi:flagellin Hag [Desulfoscipio geothermicus]|uniref:Flagellin n=1 Tax=Desulfoscipio geothermicus DSM 3669 TaxID=1121426 RepID=A0A1I6CUV1_9FIRM|nr:flagellin Hag [Desulfoscipio geothermicus]SFQ96873.1 flagellin [Desulfoscipio geothermicus DSM 3669]
MIINHNIAALNTYRQLSNNNIMSQKSLEKLSSGLRINRAGDDAAGLAISEKMRGQIRGLEQASRNAQDGISLIQTAEGALNETHSILQRMRELAVQAANDSNTITDRREIQKEVNELIDEIDRVAKNTEFNTQNLLGKTNASGTFTGSGQSFTFHIGANEAQNITLTINSMDSSHIGTSSSGSITTSVNTLKVSGVDSATSGGVLTQSGADAAITTINDAIELVSAERAKLGAYQNRLEHTINNLGTSAENLTAAESRVRDVDMAKEMMQYTKMSILQQAAQAMLEVLAA